MPRTWLIILTLFILLVTGDLVLKGIYLSSGAEEVMNMPVSEPVNHLSDAKSPYLLQHKDNPVWWHEWNDTAFEVARKEDKPVFLSIGYSACHWCHVMEEESFEDEEVAALLNEHFVAIKVDREERPDIDQVYMSVCQAMTGSGGWPLTIIMMPDKKPFYAGTYFPRNSYYGRPGMMDMLTQIVDLWISDRAKVTDIGDKITESLNRAAASFSAAELNEKHIEEAFRFFNNRFDRAFGGFGNAPKFPAPHNLMLLLRYWNKTGESEALEMVGKTLDAMMNGGIFDHLGYGFHRYSTDASWLVPHFEKMLYDQALLAMAYTEAFQATGAEKYADTARKIFDYVLRDLKSPEGGFYSAEDADSEGEEGKFYVWKKEEIIDVLGENDGAIFSDFYGVSENGNFEGSANILSIKRESAAFAAAGNIEPELLRRNLDLWRDKLFATREKRFRPFKDDKILTGWNGLMIAALAKGAPVLRDGKYLEAAQQAADFILDDLSDDAGNLLHRYRLGGAGIQANLDDYAFMIWGLLELFQSGHRAEYLDKALVLTEKMIASFWDEENGGFYFTPHDGEQLIARMKEVSDGAVPSGNSAAAYNLLRLGKITGSRKLSDRGSAVMTAFGESIEQNPGGYSMMLTALDFSLGPVKEIVISGIKNDPLTSAMIQTVSSRYLPGSVLIFADVDDAALEKLIPFIKNQPPIDGKAAAYVCENLQCRSPVTDPEELKTLLE